MEEVMNNALGNLNIRDIDENYNITVFNFKQGYIGNCGMICAMSNLAANEILFKKVVPEGQNFDSSNSTEVVFNLYKLGTLYKVKVNKKLPTENDELISCRSSNKNLVGPLLEKALVQLHFGGNYRLSKSVCATVVMSSLTNNFFEDLNFLSNENNFRLEEALNHCLKTKSQMAVSFKESVSKYKIEMDHYYNLLEVDNKNKDFVKLYNPHGEILSIPKNFLVYNKLKWLAICYYDNKIFEIPEIKTSVSITDKWPKLEETGYIHYVYYNLKIKEDDTKILMNISINLDFNHKMQPTIFIITDNEKTSVVEHSLSKDPKSDDKLFVHKKSLRANLRSGKYKIVVVVSKWDEIRSCEECQKYLENVGNEFCFRFAASKQCLVGKTTKKIRYKIDNALIDWLLKNRLL